MWTDEEAVVLDEERVIEGSQLTVSKLAGGGEQRSPASLANIQSGPVELLVFIFFPAAQAT